MLAEELFEDVIKPNIYPRATRPDRREPRAPAAARCCVSGALDFTMRPLARYLGVDDLIANRLEFVDGYATGKLDKPFVAGATKARSCATTPRDHGIDLGESWAYSDSYSDYPMLAVVGHPTAVQPGLPAALGGAVVRLAGPRSRRRLDALIAPAAGPAPMPRRLRPERLTRCAPSAPRPAPHAREHIVTIDTDSAPRILFYGENFLLEDLPVGTRVIYPKRPMTGVANPSAAIRYALNHPEDMPSRSTRCSSRA